jgi:type III pantothenate kinase
VLLVVDIGNSNLDLGLARDGALIGHRRAATPVGATPDEVELLLHQLLRLDGHGLRSVDAIALSSTVPAVGATVQEIAARRGIGCVAASAATIPMSVDVERPAEVGPDRLVNAFAAARLHGCPAVVVDCGTATTVDAVDATGAFVGGAIAPGLVLGLESLATRTARLPLVEPRLPDRAIGRDTAAAIVSGTVLGHRLLVEGLVARVRAELAAAAGVAPGQVRSILTGGLANTAWGRALEGFDVLDPDLTLRGLVMLHAETAGTEVAR